MMNDLPQQDFREQLESVLGTDRNDAIYIRSTQTSEVNEEKKKIYEPTIQYLSAKYNIEKITDIGLFFGARGTIPKAFVKWREKYKLKRDLQDAIVNTIIKFSALDADFFYAGIDALVYRCNKCLYKHVNCPKTDLDPASDINKASLMRQLCQEIMGTKAAYAVIVSSTELVSIVRSRNMFAFSSDERCFNIESYFRTVKIEFTVRKVLFYRVDACSKKRRFHPFRGLRRIFRKKARHQHASATPDMQDAESAHEHALLDADTPVQLDAHRSRSTSTLLSGDDAGPRRRKVNYLHYTDFIMLLMKNVSDRYSCVGTVIKVCFSDESTFQCLMDKAMSVRRRKGENFAPGCMVNTVKHPISVMIWSMISDKGSGRLYIVQGTMKQDQYIQFEGKRIIQIENEPFRSIISLIGKYYEAKNVLRSP
ncbi:hypothetical protein ANN_13192 [Periplaneta americana]|uniref:Uncharacterized protein n=1 Tax=Periplaneta americana TaxID=6978 RepID=A0ABQ8TK43_PERAM|nr:hypothetical protein ANN_13192 [Periplaneta americana]